MSGLKPEDAAYLKTVKLLIGLASYREVPGKFMMQAISTSSVLWQLGVRHDWTNVEGCYVHDNRNKIVATMFAYPDFTHLLFLDTDMVWEPAHVVRLLLARKDVIAGPYVRRNTNEEWTFRLPGGKIEHDGHAVVAAYAATGFMLIERGVLDHLRDEHKQLFYGKRELGEKDQPEEAHMYGLFDTRMYGGKLVGEDVLFCSRVADIGRKVWIDTGIKLGHIGDCEYRGDIRKVFDGVEV